MEEKKIEKERWKRGKDEDRDRREEKPNNEMDRGC